MPSSSARRRNAPNLISPLHVRTGSGCARPVLVHEPGDHRLGELARIVRDLEREPGDARHRLGVGARRGPQHPCSTPSRCTRCMCEPNTSYPWSASRHAATDESTPPDIATKHRTLRRHPTRLPLRAATYRSWPCSTPDSTISPAPEPSFRLVEPVGVLEATAARRGPRHRSPPPRPRRHEGCGCRASSPTKPPPASTPRWPYASARPPMPSSSCRSRGSRCSRAGRKRCSPNRGRHRADAARRMAAVRRPGAYDHAIDAHPRAHRGRRHLSGESHAAAPFPGAGRRTRAVSRPVLRATGRLRRLPQPGALSGAVGIPGTVLPRSTARPCRPIR